jgi:hypothetical protein
VDDLVILCCTSQFQYVRHDLRNKSCMYNQPDCINTRLFTMQVSSVASVIFLCCPKCWIMFLASCSDIGIAELLLSTVISVGIYLSRIIQSQQTSCYVISFANELIARWLALVVFTQPIWVRT